MPFPIPLLAPAVAIFSGSFLNRNTQTKIAEKQRETQFKLACLQIEARRHEQIDQQHFQERMSALGFARQVSLEAARNEFNVQLKQLDHQQQQKIERYRAEMSEKLQAQRLAEERRLQHELAMYQRETAMAVAQANRETAMASQAYMHLRENWPLRIPPMQIIEAFKGTGPVPLRVILSPPELSYDKNGNATQFPKIEGFLASGLRKVLNQHYAFTDTERPTQLLDGAWDTNRFHGGASMMTLFGLLKSEPTLILESSVLGDYLNLRVGYWGLGQPEDSHYFYEELLSKFPYQQVLFASAKVRAKRWLETRDKLLALGKDLATIQKRHAGAVVKGGEIGLDALNAALLEEEVTLAAAGVLIEQHYHVCAEDWEALYGTLETLHAVLACWFADVHHFLYYDTPLKLPELLSELLAADTLGVLPVDELVTNLVQGYLRFFQAFAAVQSHRVPEVLLCLAGGLVELRNQDHAKGVIAESLRLWLAGRGLEAMTAEVVQGTDVPYLLALAAQYEAVEMTAEAAAVREVVESVSVQLALAKLWLPEAQTREDMQSFQRLLSVQMRDAAQGAQFRQLAIEIVLCDLESEAQALMALPTWQVGDEFQDELKQGGKGPVMVVLPQGDFQMGSNKESCEQPIHTVTIAYEFAMGKYPVIFEEYDAYCEATGANKPGDNGWGRGKRPVINVSWHDAVAYCKWLSEQTGEQYRLPSEAKWEYACRAGTTTEYWWGDEMDDSRCWYEGNSGDKTHQVNEAEGQHTNPWGLVDMLGNVWEWTGSEYVSPYNGNELKFVRKNDASRPVLRGGSWYNGPIWGRSANRNFDTVSNRNLNIGFRLARM